MKLSIREKSNYLKSSRMLAIFERLSSGETINKTQEADRFGVNEKTVQRDIEDLRSYLQEFHPEEKTTSIIYDRMKKGYVLLRDQQSWLSKQEILAVAKVLLESRAFAKEEMDLMLNKLVIQSGHVDRICMKDVISNERFHYVPLQHGNPLFQTIWDLSMAAREQRLLQIEYTRVGDQKQVKRILEPQGILFSEYYFYLMAYIQGTDYDTPTIYRLDKINEYRILDDHFYLPYSDRFEGGELRKRIQFMQSGELVTIRFRFWGESLEAVLDRLPTAKVIEENENEAIVEAQVFGGQGIKMWLLSQGEYLEVIFPNSFREDMYRTILAMESVYSNCEENKL